MSVEIKIDPEHPSRIKRPNIFHRTLDVWRLLYTIASTCDALSAMGRALMVIRRLAQAFAVALLFPCVVNAVGIGEIVSQSRLGAPLLAQVELVVGSGEHIEDSCLSLAAPDPTEEDTSGYLTQANLSLKTEENRQYVTISTRNPFNEAFAKLRLQIKCPGKGSIIKTLAILPDMDTIVSQAPIAAPSVLTEAEFPPPPSDAHDVAPASNQIDSRKPQPPDERDIHAENADKVARPANKRHPVRAKGRPPSFSLKISGEPINKPHVGKIGAKERALLLEQQKMLDADEQMVRFLTIQNQLKKLQDELAGIKLQLAQLEDIPATAASSVASSAASTVVPAPSTAPLAIHPKPEAKPVLRKVALPPPPLSLWDEISGEPLYLAGGAAALLGLGGIGFMLARRRSMAGMGEAAKAYIAAPVAPSPDNGDFMHTAAPVRQSAVPEYVDPISEADLFLNFGRDVQAEEILKDALQKNPGNQQIRLKLLSIYAGRKDTVTFSDIARQVKDSGDAAAWALAAGMGRKLEPGNPTYGGDDSSVVAIGEADKADAKHASLDFDLG